MKYFKIKSYCKINLTLRIAKKLSNGYHNIVSLITFCGLHDVVLISKVDNFEDKITFTGKFRKGINNHSNTITNTLNLLRKNKLLDKKSYKIIVQKKIPHGSGLGGGSSNAASLLNYFKLKKKINNKKIEKISRQIGFDVPISLKKKNTLLTGKGGQLLRFNKNFKLNLLIVYPNIICSTKKIYKKNMSKSIANTKIFFNINNNKKLINILKNEDNDLEKTVFEIYPKVKKVIKLIKSQKGCHFSRITGSGSACIGIFSNMKNAIYAKKMIKIKYPKYWCVVSKTI